MTKPNTLPAVEIVKDKPNQMGKPQMGSRIDFNDQMMTLLLFDSNGAMDLILQELELRKRIHGSTHGHRR